MLHFFQNASCFKLSIPMPGHSVGESTGKNIYYILHTNTERVLAASNITERKDSYSATKHVEVM